jgi:hypothetical protein
VKEYGFRISTRIVHNRVDAIRTKGWRLVRIRKAILLLGCLTKRNLFEIPATPHRERRATSEAG